jgi:hypothetical protein
MPDQEHAIPPAQPAVEDVSIQDTAVQADQTVAYAPVEERDEWLEEPAELPRRPRRRLLSPVPLALLGVLIAVCGFIGGVLVQKGQGSSTASAAGSASSLASRFAALRAGASGAAGSSAAGTSSAAGGLLGAGGGATTGTVAYISGNTLYVTTAEGNTVKVTTSAGTTVTKTVKADVTGIHPGEAVTVTGAGESGGTVSAESIRVGGGAGGLGALFGSGTRGGSGSGGGRGGSGEPALFGNGGG